MKEEKANGDKNKHKMKKTFTEYGKRSVYQNWEPLWNVITHIVVPIIDGMHLILYL